MSDGILAGKTGVVFGVANKRSIAWAIAKAWAAAGAKLIFNYQGERLKENVEDLVGEFGADTPLYPCDVSNDSEISDFFGKVREQTTRLDLMLHSVAYAPKEALEGDFVSTSREAFRISHDISAYSLLGLAREASAFMTDGGSIIAMTYYGAEKVVPHYNVMGVAKASLEATARYLAYDLGPKKIRVNCISAGPVQTLAARGIAGFSSMLKHYQEHAPLKRSCEPSELGATGVFLASEGAAAITGQVIYVDGGYQIYGNVMKTGRRYALWFSVLVAAAPAQAADLTAVEALKLVPPEHAKNLTRIEGREGKPFPDRWRFIVFDSATEAGVREIVVADEKVVASRTVSQFAEKAAATDVIDPAQIEFDSDKAVALAEKYAAANHAVIDRISYTLSRENPDAPPYWLLRCYDAAANRLAEIKILATKGEVLSHDGFAEGPTPSPKPVAKTRTVREAPTPATPTPLPIVRRATRVEENPVGRGFRKFGRFLRGED